tara:strand:- start:1685 stop:2287 length:603 start_codon:yes stop_codon:yes gene_type:complete
MKNYSQINQDLYYLKYSKYRKCGYFLDIGANDGVTFSNTYLLETNYSYTGLCIEADPSAVEKCKESRRCEVEQIAIWDTKGTIEYSRCPDTLLNGVANTLADDWKSKFQFKNQLVKCDTLYNILEKNNCPNIIDYASIDIEGAEMRVLTKFFEENNDKYTFNYIDIEHNYKYFDEILGIMISNGYSFLRENSWDCTFVKL